jgi:TolB protein
MINQPFRLLLVILTILAAGTLGACATTTTDPGARIVFNSTRDGNYEVYSMRPDGAEQTNLTNSDATEWVYAGGDKAYFVSDGYKGAGRREYQLYEMNADGSSQRRISRFPLYDSYLGVINHGERFLVTSKKDGDAEIYLIDRSGNELAQLTDNDGYDSDPDISPDGLLIVFRSNRDGPNDLYTMRPDGSQVKRLTSDPSNDNERGYGGEGPARFSPDGAHLAWASYVDDNWEIHTMRHDGTDRKRLTHNTWEDGYPCWSPDGQSIIFFAGLEPENFEIFSCDTDGANMQQITNNTSTDIGAVWVRATN